MNSLVPHSYNVAYFDVLGFSSRLKLEGLESVVDKYQRLADVVHRQNAACEEFAGAGFRESAYAVAGGDIVALQMCEAAYASDSFIVWAHSYFPVARGLSAPERDKLSSDPKTGWAYLPVPCDIFLNICCELFCVGLECGLPLRGAISRGEAILDRRSGFFIGEPLVEAASLEKTQAALALGFCESFMEQHVPARFLFQFSGHMKPSAVPDWSGQTLAWGRHWASTRSSNPCEAVKSLAYSAGGASQYYKNTLRMLDHVDQRTAVAVRGVNGEYPQFCGDHVLVDVVAVRDPRK